MAATAGYALTEAQDAQDGIHHRLDGKLGAAITPRRVSWLSLALRLDGRLDLHPDDGMGKHTLPTGDPRLIARGGSELDDGWQLGGEVSLWLPGEGAPSIAFDALTTDFRALTAYDLPGSAWSLLGAAGLRLDFSHNAAPPLERLRPGDRLGLGLSDSHALLFALGTAYTLSPGLSLFGEISTDLLLGSDAPSAGQSPWRITAGARGGLGRGAVGETAVTLALSGRPAQAPSDPLVPVEPRLSVSAGVRWGRSFVGPQAGALTGSSRGAAGSQVSGQLLDAQGQPLPDAAVTLELSSGERREVLTDAQGHYRFDGVPLGPADLRVEAQGFAQMHWTLEVGDGPSVQPPHKLALRANESVLRGLTRSFRSQPLRARIVVFDRRGKTVAKTRADARGHFEILLPPGRFTVNVSAPGYHDQRRRIRVTDNSVTVLNVDLRQDISGHAK